MSGDRPFSRGHLYKLLANPIYAGRLGHKGRVHAGQHPAIIVPDVFGAVQSQLARNNHPHQQNRAAFTHLMAGRIGTCDGKPMKPSHAQKAQTRYCYYLARSVLEGSPSASPIRRIAAAPIGTVVLASVRAATSAGADMADADLIAAHLKQVSVHPDRFELEIVGQDEPMVVPWSLGSIQRRRDILVPPGENGRCCG